MATIPHKVDIERALVNMILGSQEAVIIAITELTTSMFYDNFSSLIFKAANELASENLEVSYVTIKSRLEQTDTARLVDFNVFSPDPVYTESKIRSLISLIKEVYLVRQRIKIAEQIVGEGYKAKDYQKFLKDSDDSFWKSTALSNTEMGITSSGAMLSTRSKIMRERINLRPVLFGYPSLDQHLSGGGFSSGTVSVIAGRPAMGKCKKFDTPVLTSQGYRQIKDLEEGDEVLTFSGEKFEFCKVKRVVSNGIKPIFKLRIKGYGYEDESSSNHPYLTLGGWKELKDLTPGDSIVGPRKLFLKEQNGSNCSSSFCRLIGYLIGDGGLTTGIHFTTSNMLIAKDIELILKAKYDKAVELKLIKATSSFSKFRVAKPSGQANKLPNLLRNDLRRLGLFGKGSHNKFIPPELVTSLENIRNLLIGLWETDGSVDGYSSVSLRLIKDVQNLLLYFGVLTTLETKKTSWGPKGASPSSKKRSITYRLRLTHQTSIINFWEEVGYYLTESPKKDNLATLKNQSLVNQFHSNLDNLPKEAWDIIKKYISMKELFYELGRNSYGNVSRATSQGLSRSYLLRIIEAINKKRNYRPSELVKLLNVDIEVEGNHNFVANNLIVHNSLFKANLIKNLCESGIGVVNVAIEQTIGTEMDRIDTLLTEIPLKDLKGVRYWPEGDERIIKVQEAQQHIDQNWNYHIIHRRGLSLKECFLRLQQIQNQRPVQVVFFDLFDKLIDVNVAQNKPQVVSSKLGEASIIAERLNLHVCLLVQINREVDKRKDRRPMLADLKDAGAYEEVARLVLLLYRDSYYNPDNINDILEVNIAKQSDGPSNIKEEFELQKEIGRMNAASISAHIFRGQNETR